MSETLEQAADLHGPDNPLLRAWQTPFETPPFDEIAPEHFLPAFEQAFADHAAEIAAIVNDPSAPDFHNTITALERSGRLLAKVSAVFYDLVSAHSNPALLEIDKEISLRMARHWNPIMMNAVLFGRIVMLHDNRTALDLTGEQMRLLERTYTRFHRAGAGLDEAAKARMATINEHLAHLGTTFSHHLLGDEQEWFLELGEDDREGLSDSFIAAAKAAAEERGMAGNAIVTLSRSSVEPFLKSARRDGRGVFVLVRTSNPGAGQFQDLVCDGKPVYRHVAEAVGEWAREHLGDCGFGDAGAVVGATHPAELAAVRGWLPEAVLLVPGYGAQGGTAADTAAAFRDDGLGAVVNSSRGITACFDPADVLWEERVLAATRAVRATL